MGTTAQQVADLVDMLPNVDQQLALDLVKKLVLAWKPNYNKALQQRQKKDLIKVSIQNTKILIGCDL